MADREISQIALPVENLPKRWYNIQPDLPRPLPPPMDPEEGPSRIEQLPRFILKHCLEQEQSKERWIPIPGEVRQLYIQACRPRPLMRALRLEEQLKLPATIRLYYKREDLSPTGSHKVNTALAQCWYAQKEGYTEVTTETGAGQWGSALAYAASLNKLKCRVFWVRSAYSWKPGRLQLMRLYGADVYASPSPETATGKELLESDPDHPGDLGIAISEGIEDALERPNATYCLGSVLNHVIIHQSIIGLETLEQFKKIDDYPTQLIGCFGGGSNFGGFTLPFIGEAIHKKLSTKFLAAQSQAAPNITTGKYMYDHADHAGKTPLLKMYTLGHKASIPIIMAEGLRYSGASPILSLLRNENIIQSKAYPSDEIHVFTLAKLFMQTEGFIIAPESAYAVAAAIDQAREAKQKDEDAIIAFNISGHGFLDLPGYAKILG